MQRPERRWEPLSSRSPTRRLFCVVLAEVALDGTKLCNTTPTRSSVGPTATESLASRSAGSTIGPSARTGRSQTNPTPLIGSSLPLEEETIGLRPPAFCGRHQAERFHWSPLVVQAVARQRFSRLGGTTKQLTPGSAAWKRKAAGCAPRPAPETRPSARPNGGAKRKSRMNRRAKHNRRSPRRLLHVSFSFFFSLRLGWFLFCSSPPPAGPLLGVAPTPRRPSTR